MRRGVLEQVDTPENLYEYPVNQFVAEFIGSPPMNIIEGVLKVRDGAKTAGISDGGDFLPLPVDNLKELGLKVGDTIRVGIRPESITFNPDSDNTIEVEVSRMEPIGHEGLVYFTLFDTDVTARVSRWQELKGKNRARIAVGADDVYLFSPEDQTCLWARGKKMGNRRFSDDKNEQMTREDEK
jgi:multiple sugar transport system ATP-binding protein